MDMLEGETKVRDYDLERLIMLTDGVFAIAMTLLALELRPPEGWDGHLASLVAGVFRDFVAYAMSFFFVAIYWASHRRTFKRFKRADGIVTAINLFILAMITLVPFASRLITEHHPRGEPLLIYMGLVVSIGIANALQWGYAAFIGRDILETRMGWPLKLLIFLILLLVPSLMAGLSMTAMQPGYKWLYGPMFGFLGVVVFLRRYIGRKHGA